MEICLRRLLWFLARGTSVGPILMCDDHLSECLPHCICDLSPLCISNPLNSSAWMAWLSAHLSKQSLLTIERDSLPEEAPTVNVSELLEYEQVASFNWRGSKQRPVLVVPGAPRAFTAWRGGQLQADVGELVSDYNHYMLPRSPTEPVLRALIVCFHLDTPFSASHSILHVSFIRSMFFVHLCFTCFQHNIQVIFFSSLQHQFILVSFVIQRSVHIVFL